MSLASLKELREGDLVHFTYKMQSGNGQWYEWESTAVFLNIVGDTATPMGQEEILISYRPHAGTSRIPVGGLIHAERLETAKERMFVTRSGGDERCRLPKRKKGAVPAP